MRCIEGWFDLEIDDYGYVKGGPWHPTVAELQDARRAWHLAGPSEELNERLDKAEEEAEKLRQKIFRLVEDDMRFFYNIASLYGLMTGEIKVEED